MTKGEIVKALANIPDEQAAYLPDWWIFSESSQDPDKYLISVSCVELGTDGRLVIS